MVAVASCVPAALGDSGTEAGDAAPLRREVALGAVPCSGGARPGREQPAAPCPEGFLPVLPGLELDVSVKTPSGMPNTRPLALMASQVYAPWSASFTSRMVRVPRPFLLVMEILRARNRHDQDFIGNKSIKNAQRPEHRNIFTLPR